MVLPPRGLSCPCGNQLTESDLTITEADTGYVEGRAWQVACKCGREWSLEVTATHAWLSHLETLRDALDGRTPLLDGRRAFQRLAESLLRDAKQVPYGDHRIDAGECEKCGAVALEILGDRSCSAD